MSLTTSGSIGFRGVGIGRESPCVRAEIGRGLQSASVERGGDGIVEFSREACVRGVGGVREVMPALKRVLGRERRGGRAAHAAAAATTPRTQRRPAADE